MFVLGTGKGPRRPQSRDARQRSQVDSVNSRLGMWSCWSLTNGLEKRLTRGGGPLARIKCSYPFLEHGSEVRPQFSLFRENLGIRAGYLNSFRSLVPTEVERNWKLAEMPRTDTGGAAGPWGPWQD